jgi:arylsulfatase A-like enzyme
MMTHGSNVLILVCDTLRPDYLSCYGGDVSTPAFNSLAEGGTLFERAYAAGPGSSISHAALFTGQYPSESGVVGQVDLPEDVPVIAEWFRDHDYETFGIPGPSRIGSHWGYDRGFDQYVEKWKDIPSSPTLADLRRALADPTLLRPMPRHAAQWLTRGNGKHTGYLLYLLREKIRRDLDRPFFAFTNVTTVHSPYDPPRPYKEEATPGLDRPRWEWLEWVTDRGETFNQEGVRADRVYEAQSHRGDANFFADKSWLNDAEIDVLRDWYAASVRYLDDELGRFLDYYEHHLADDTVLVVLADHGEHLGERGLLKHMYSHFDECLHVPLLIRGPGVPADERRTDFVSLVDVFDTVCDLTGLDAPETTSGQSIFGDGVRDAVFAENGVREVTDAFAELLSPERQDRFRRGYKSVRTDEYLYLLDSSGEESLYARPGETRIDDPEDETLDRLGDLCRDELGTEFGRGYQDDDFDDAVEANLRQLGYLE